MIKKMSLEYEKELIDFIYKYNRRKEHYVAWLPDYYEELVAMNKESFYLCMEEEQLVGCLGTYQSREQGIVRLLGPIILPEYFSVYADSLYDACRRDLPEEMKEIRIAFYEENEWCRHWCDATGFELYNVERTMIYAGQREMESIDGGGHQSTAIIRPFEPGDKEGLSLVHPEGTFFTLNELIGQISEQSHLLIAVSDSEVMGYIFYEMTADKTVGEITLLHVKETARGKGIGSELLKYAIDELNKEQVSEITINVRKENEGAFRLYSRFGFMEKERIYAYRKELHTTD
jgi:ribosomal protein S18 acetylase RimI-like enzyme